MCWIGRAGDMRETPCVSSMQVSTEQRTVLGGGVGTLAPRRVRVYGAGGREWSLSIGAGRFGDTAVLTSLARRQARFGGSLRLVPCDALSHNLYSPQASEDFAGWASQYFVMDPADAVGLDVGPRGPALVARQSGVSTLDLPPTVLPYRAPVHGAIYYAHSSTEQVRARIMAYDASGSRLDALSPAYQDLPATGGELVRFELPEWDPAVGVAAAGLRTHVPAGSSDAFFAWPSIAYEQTPYTPGRAADAVHISMPARDVLHTWGEGIESTGYTITEVGQ